MRNAGAAADLRRGSALSRQYAREPAPAPPHALDRRVLKLSKDARGNSPCLAPLALAASVLLSVALVLAIARSLAVDMARRHRRAAPSRARQRS